jgi:hypothetical protein
MTARIEDNQLKGALFMILFIVLILQSLLSSAQSAKHDGQYRGFAAGFGARSTQIHSTIQKIDRTTPILNGGELGVMFGRAGFKSKIGLLGYYSSAGNFPGTIDLYSSNVSVNFYPLSLINADHAIVQPYLTGGLDYDRFKFYGYYLNREPGYTNYSQSEAPYLGKIRAFNATAGLGVEVKLLNQFDFIHLFSEVRCGRNLSREATNAAFQSTALTDQMQVTVGVAFGAIR